MDKLNKKAKKPERKSDSLAKSKGSTANTVRNRRDSTARALAKLGIK